MASRRLTQPARMLTVLSLSVAATFSALPTGVGQAEPRPSLEQVERQVDALNARIEMVNEEYGGSRLKLAAATRRAAVASGRVRVRETELAAVRKSMAAVAAAAYKAGNTDQFVQLVSTSSPQTFLDRASTLNRIAADQNARLTAASTARHRLTVEQRSAAAALDAQRAISAKMAEQKASIDNALAKQERLLSSLKGEQRRALAARRAAAARAEMARASRSLSDRPTYTGPASGRAAIAVREAYRQLGKPYQWGAAGPDRFDCSGLTMWVWGKAGVSLPHQSRAQYASGRKVAKSDLQPGDLVYFGSPIHHVAIYVGNGQMISAPQTGDVVKLRNAMRPDYTGATRP